MSNATKILWLLVSSYFILMFVLAFLEIGPLDFVMAENSGAVILSAVGIQFLIKIYNSFMSGLKN